MPYFLSTALGLKLLGLVILGYVGYGLNAGQYFDPDVMDYVTREGRPRYFFFITALLTLAGFLSFSMGVTSLP